MNKRNRTILFRASSFVAGAALNYSYLLLTGKINRDNLGLLVFFAVSFMVFATELVTHFKLLKIDVDNFRVYFGAGERTPENEAKGAQSTYIFLFFCIVIVTFQTM